MTSFNESTVEQATLKWLSNLGWETAYGPDIAPGTPAAERDNYTEVVLERRLRDALERLNPDLDDEALETALRRITNPDGPTQEARNRSFHLDLINGVTVEQRGPDGTVSGVPAKLIDFEDPHEKRLAGRSTSSPSRGTNKHRRLDIVLFVNGLPLGNIELKNPADESTDIWQAWDQFQTYQAELPEMFSMNEIQIISDGLLARIGPLGAGKEWFKPWRTMESEEANTPQTSELQVMLEGTCDPTRFLNLVKNFTVFDNDGSGKLIKKLAGYHQLHAVQAAVEETLRATALQREAALTHQAEGQPTRWGARRPAHRGGMAQPGVRQEPDHGILHGHHRPGTGDGKPDHRGPHRPERPGWPTLRDLLPLPGPSEADANPSRQ